jgi:chromosome segregation ATPase
MSEDAQNLTQLDRLEQLADHTSAMAEALERHEAALTTLDGRLASIEGAVAALQRSQERTADRVETLATTLDASARLDRLEERVGAVHAGGERTADRVETVAAEVQRVAGLENALGHLRAEIAERMSEQAEETSALQTRTREDFQKQIESTRLRIEEQIQRVERLEPLPGRIESLERRDEARDRTVGEMVERVEQVAKEREALQEIALRTEHETTSRVESLAAVTEALREELRVWPKRIEEQDEVLRAARLVAEEMRQEAVRLREEHGRTAEAQRVAEARVEHSLAALRQESADTWETFIGRRTRERQEADRHRQTREETQRVALAEALEALEHRIQGRLLEMDGRLTGDEEALDTLRRVMAEVVVRWRDEYQEAARAIEALLPGSAKPALVEERRQALRRALRARRDHGDGR